MWAMARQTSWMAVRSLSSILSNSSMQQMPMSASTCDDMRIPDEQRHAAEMNAAIGRAFKIQRCGSLRGALRTSAPPSSTNSEVFGSLITAAVRPTPEEPLPVVYTPRGATLEMCFKS